jgi:hypothetical protein
MNCSGSSYGRGEIMLYIKIIVIPDQQPHNLEEVML